MRHPCDQVCRPFLYTRVEVLSNRFPTNHQSDRCSRSASLHLGRRHDAISRCKQGSPCDNRMEIAECGTQSRVAKQLKGLSVGAPRSTPAPGDFDGDGSIDLIAGECSGSFRYLESPESATSSAFIARTGIASSRNGQNVGSFSTPTRGDVDHDGDMDVIWCSAIRNLSPNGPRTGRGAVRVVRLLVGGVVENTASSSYPPAAR